MTTRFSIWLIVAVCCSVIVVPAGWAVEPTIESVRVEKTDLILKVTVPPGTVRLTLEGRSRFTTGTWIPRGVLRPATGELHQIFRVPLEVDSTAELLRVRADAAEPLPAGFYAKSNTFPAQLDYTSPMLLRGAALDTAGPTAGATTSAGTAVVESDIWSRSGDRLFFFNQYRGLQVMDLSDVDHPRLIRTLPVPMAGEQMYHLEDGRLVLLVQDRCGNGWAGSAPSAVWVVDPQPDPPAVLARLDVPGQIVESRMVGRALHVASQAYRQAVAQGGADPGSWEWGMALTSFDLSDPAGPVKRSESWIPGYGPVITATPSFFLVATQDPSLMWQSELRIFDLRRADGTAVLRSRIRPGGRIADKFKLAVQGTVLSVISEQTAPGDATGTRWLTRLETFSLDDPSAPTRLGKVELGHGERLFASRFDGNRVYVVTFLRTDPLWVVDLTDPSAPRIAGEVQVPGWSTYIEPLGDRLVTVGVETNRVAVSLFDVSVPAKPRLDSRVLLGETYSWSEANQDEKAFNVLEDQGLILLPYQGQTTNGYASRIQWVDLKPHELSVRGTLDHSLQPRRAMAWQGRVLTVSGRELLIADDSDRDHPRVTASLPLSWTADRAFPVGSQVVVVTDPQTWPAPMAGAIRTVAVDKPDVILATTQLPDAGPVLGCVLRQTTLHVLQGRSTEIVWSAYDPSHPSVPQVPLRTNQAQLTFTMVDVSNPLKPVGSNPVITTFGQDIYWGSFGAAWLDSGTLVFSSEGNRYPILYGRFAVDGRFPWWGGMGTSELLAYAVPANVGESARLLSRVTSEQTLGAGTSGTSPAYLAAGKAYLSRQRTDFLEGFPPPGTSTPTSTITVTKDPGTGATVTNISPIGSWITRHELVVVDYQDPREPVIRKPVALPSPLVGVHPSGEMVFTLGGHNDPVTLLSDGLQWLDAVAYDGVSTHGVDAVRASATWPHPALTVGSSVILGDPGSNAGEAALNLWTVRPTGRWEIVATLRPGAAIQELYQTGSGQVFGTDGSGALHVLRGSALQEGVLQRVGAGVPASCFWADPARMECLPEGPIWLPRGDYGLERVDLTSK